MINSPYGVFFFQCFCFDFCFCLTLSGPSFLRFKGFKEYSLSLSNAQVVSFWGDIHIRGLYSIGMLILADIIYMGNKV